MSEQSLYPRSPTNVPDGLTQASTHYKRQAWLAMLGLLGFMGFYVALMSFFGYIAYSGIHTMQYGHANGPQLIITVCALLLTVFMAKSLFAVRRSGAPSGIEVTPESEPRLFDFLNQLADEVGAPKPHRVFITPDVNAAVFYDLSLMNLIVPSKKNLIIGLGLVNVLSLGELKAVLAHEFGHFAQNSMMVGRWVYIAQQIIGHMVATRDWLDSLVRFISRIDIRVAWFGWLISLIIWSIRSLMDTLFGLVIIAERALSREMEFNADLVAVSVTGSDALINALHKLQAADHAWQTAINIANREASGGKRVEDLFYAQKATIEEIRRVLNDKGYGATPAIPEGTEAQAYRVFSEDFARPPQMWSTHPHNRDREDNAKRTYIPAAIDNRDAWTIFANPAGIRKSVSLSLYNSESSQELDSVSPLEAVVKSFNKPSYSPEFRGTYLNRSPVRSFSSISEMLGYGRVEASATESIARLYPESIVDALTAARNLDEERDTLKALQRGDLKPSGGVIRHRGKILKKKDIPEAIKEVNEERILLEEKLKQHDASCRRAHLQAAEQLGHGWHDYLLGLLSVLHCAEHMLASVENEQAVFLNTWHVITADGQIGYFEKRRMIRTCQHAHELMNEVTARATEIVLPQPLLDDIGIENWANAFPEFGLVEVTKKNWVDWCQVAAESMEHMAHALGILQTSALEALIKTETELSKHITENTQPGDAPTPGLCPDHYPILLPGNESELQRKLDLWNRFQLAHGVGPTLLRLIVSLGIVGGTIYGGVAFI